MVCRLVPLLVGGVFAFQTAAAQQAPRPERPALVVNMVVGGLPYDFVTRYGHNLSEGGFRRLAESGVSFTSARYDYMPTDRASSLATITTGTYPSVHGVVGERWCDVLTGEEVELIADSEAAGFDCEYGQGCYSNVNLIAPTLGDRLRAESPASKVVSIAADPVSAIVMAGLGTEAYWVNTATAGWTSSSRYMLYLPGWVERFNDQYRGNSYLADWFWTLHLGPERYVNRRYGRIDLPEDARFRELAPIGGLPCTAGGGRYVPVFATPLASDLVADFAMQAVVREELGQDEAPDILNICFDAPRDIIAHYGPESVEAEDMFYQLDRTVGSLISFIVSQVGQERVLFVLTSDTAAARLSMPPRLRRSVSTGSSSEPSSTASCVPSTAARSGWRDMRTGGSISTVAKLSTATFRSARYSVARRISRSSSGAFPVLSPPATCGVEPPAMHTCSGCGTAISRSVRATCS